MGKYQELAGAKFSDAPQRRATVQVTLRTEEARQAILNAMADGLREVFETKVLHDAKGLCPVGTDPIEPGSQRNRDSLGVQIWIAKKGKGVRAKLYSESGHGGFVEVGTVHMDAQPYAWPALQMNIGSIMSEMKQRIRDAKVGEVGRVTEEEAK